MFGSVKVLRVKNGKKKKEKKEEEERRGRPAHLWFQARLLLGAEDKQAH